MIQGGMPTTETALATTLSGYKKAAILLTSVSDEASAAILRQLSEDEVHEIAREITLLGKPADTDRHEVLKEFVEAVETPQTFRSGGAGYATSVLLTAFGPEDGKRMAQRLLESIETKTNDTLRKADPQTLAKIVKREHPQTIALVLSHLNSGSAGKLLANLPPELRGQVVRRMAALDRVSPEVIRRLASLIEAKLSIGGDTKMESCGGVRAVADLLNSIESATTEEILQAISTDDPDLGTNIRQLMFVFEDLVKVSEDAMRKLLAQVDRKILTMALKGSSQELKNHFTSVMSSRAAEMLVEDMQALGPVRIKDVQEAQQAIIAVARQLQDKGEISLSAGGAEDFVE